MATFEYALVRLIEQRVQCVNHKGDLCLINDRGHRCAVGWLMTEEEALKNKRTYLPAWVGSDLGYGCPGDLRDFMKLHDTRSPLVYDSVAQRFPELAELIATYKQIRTTEGSLNVQTS